MELRESSAYRHLRLSLLGRYERTRHAPSVEEAFITYSTYPRTIIRAAVEDLGLVCPQCAKRPEIGACTHAWEPGWLRRPNLQEEVQEWYFARSPSLSDAAPEQIFEEAKEAGFMPVQIQSGDITEGSFGNKPFFLWKGPTGEVEAVHGHSFL
jgi:hypothetical protein